MEENVVASENSLVYVDINPCEGKIVNIAGFSLKNRNAWKTAHIGSKVAIMHEETTTLVIFCFHIGLAFH